MNLEYLKNGVMDSICDKYGLIIEDYNSVSIHDEELFKKAVSKEIMED